VPISADLMPDIAAHISRAQSSTHPGLGNIIPLTREATAKVKQNRRNAIRGHAPAGLGKSLDEYPFASSVQSAQLPRPSVVPVDSRENWMQGGIISGAYKMQNITPGKRFMVVVIPKNALQSLIN
jgi:hypothetical protein